MITIEDFEYDVPDTVAPGATITVVNEDAATHTVTNEDGAFDVSVDASSQTTFTAPEEPGEYPFICTIHPAMTSTLVVG